MDVNFCGTCGASLPSKSAKICLKCGADPRIPSNYCTNCGEKLKSKTAIVCLKCGAPIRGGGPVGGKDPVIAALISAVCMLILAAPAAGYFYLNDMRKGLLYLIIGWVLVGVVGGMYLLSTTFTGVGLCCCLPLFLVPLAFDVLVVYDVYLQAKGEKTLLPSI